LPPDKPQASDAAGSSPRAAVLAGYFGWTLDAFDFFLVVLTLTAIGKEFGKSTKEMALTLTVTLAFRPVGAFIFGLVADRYGRRLPLMLDLVFYSVIEVLSGFAPNYTVFVILRALFGIGMGAEWGLGASLAMEQVPPRLRGVLSGFLQEGYAAGYLLAAIAYYFIFPRWGWRPLFFLGGLPALLALFVQYKVKESKVWEESRHENWGQLGRSIASHWQLFLYIVLLMTTMNFASHGTQDLYPTVLESEHHLRPTQQAMVTAISMIGAIIGGIVFGLFSDRFGRRRAIVAGLLLAIVMIPLWAYAPNTALLVLGAFLMQFMVQGAWGVIPAHLSELTPNSVRGFLPGFAYQCGVLFAGILPYIEAVYAPKVSLQHAMALTALTVFILAAIAAAAGRENRGVSFRGNPATDGVN